MDLTYRQEVGVGVLVILGLVIFTGMMFYLTGRSVTSSGIAARVVFANVQGLKEGDPVLVSGVKKGRVARVQLDRVGHVTVTLQLTSDVAPRSDASATIAASDFFGAKFVDYFPGAKTEPLGPGQTITGTLQPQLADVASGVATRANELLGSAKGLVSDQLAVDIHNTMVATQRAMNVIGEVGSGPLVNQTTHSLAAAERMMSHIDTLLASGPGRRIDTLTTNLAKLTTQLGEATGSLKSLVVWGTGSNRCTPYPATNQWGRLFPLASRKGSPADG